MPEVVRTQPLPGQWVDGLPHDVEPIGEGGTLRGRLSDGRQVVARPVSTATPEEGRRLAEHLRRMAALAEPNLVPVRGAVLEEDVIWVVADLAGGMSLRELLRHAQPTPPVAAAIGIEVLAGLASLQRAGVTHGALHAGNVFVCRDGRVRLGDYALRPRFRPGAERLGWGDPRNDIIAAGVLLCAALGVSPVADAAELSDAERSMPALVATARALAAGRGGRNAGAALGTVRAAAGRLSDPAHRRRELAGLVHGAVPAPAREPDPDEAPVAPGAGPPRPGPGPVPAAPVWQAPTPPWPASPSPRPAGAAGPPVSRPVVWVVAAVAAALVLSALVALVFHVTSSGSVALSPTPRPTSAPPTAAATAPPPAAQPSAPAQPSPSASPAKEEDGQQGGADSPVGAVDSFYQLVQRHRFDQAVQLWSDRMQADYPPQENVYQRFADTTSLTVTNDQLTSSGEDAAAVAVSLVEVRDGQTYRWTGTWYLVRGSSGWLLDQPALVQA